MILYKIIHIQNVKIKIELHAIYYGRKVSIVK
jgi:hypothetical protein